LSLTFAQHGDLLAALVWTRLLGAWGQRAKIWDSRTGNLLHSFPLGEGAQRMALTPDGKRLATLHAYKGPGFQPRSGPNEVKLWDVATGQELLAFRLNGPLAFFKSDIAFSPDGTRLAAALATVEIWSTVPSIPLPVPPAKAER